MVSDLDESEKQRVSVFKKVERKENSEKQRVSVLHEIKQKASTTLIGPNKNQTPPRRSTRFNLPPGKQRVSERLRLGSAHHASIHGDFRPYADAPTFIAPVAPRGFENLTIDEDIERFRLLVGEDDPPSCLTTTVPNHDISRTAQPMPKVNLPPVFPTRPLNLNEDGSTINYRKSHSGPHAEYWQRADAEEIERLFVTGTIAPIHFRNIPSNRVITYVNPVCVEKTNDDGSMKFRTRLTIGGDRIQYPYDTAAVTAEMDAIKILLNCMISENAEWSTIDLTDFYLGTDLPHPEYIRIPRNLIPNKVINFYDLERFFNNNTLYCSVHKTHYGLPQAGALSQQRLFQHLKEHGYIQIPSSPSVFRNLDGSIRFTLVVDDFAVVWKDRAQIDHFIETLTLLYQVKVNWGGTKYLGMDVKINREKRHVTLTMAGYIRKLLQRGRPHGIKGASTPAQYTSPNYAHPGAQKATMDDSPIVSESDQKLLQSVVGTLLYYARAVDPSICTAVHQLGSVQAKPTENDMRKMDRLLQYVSTHSNNGIRYYASNMILQLMSDASYLSRPKARSVCGGFGYFGCPTAINGPLMRQLDDRLCMCFCCRSRDSGWFSNCPKCDKPPPHRVGPWIPTAGHLASNG